MPLVRAGTPHVLMIHDADPHDETHAIPWQRRAVMGLIGRRVTAVVVFSRAVESIVASRNPDRDIAVIPLPSEMPDDKVPPFVQADLRRDFFCIGRIRPYKNLAVVARAWQQHVDSPAYRGDTLNLIGSGEVDFDLPVHANWFDGSFSFTEVAPRLAAGKGSIAVYRNGSQSGAQLFSMQVGCAPIVSTAGGLHEYQLPEIPPVDPADIPGLVSMLGRLSDSRRSAALGAACKDAYQERFSARSSGARLATVLEEVVAAGHSRRRP